MPVVAAGGVAECRKYRECPVCPGLRRCLHVWPGRLAPAAVCRHCSTAAGQHPHFQSTRLTAQTQGSHFYPQLPELSRRRRREYNQEFALRSFCCILLTKKYQSFKKCEFWSSRARHSPALAYQQTGQWRATLEIKLAPAINTAPTTSSPTLH